MIKNLAVLDGADPLNQRGRQLYRARAIAIRLNTASGHESAVMTRRSDKYDISALGQALKKFIAWLRDVFNND
ncbi:hypothetical protein [Acerihabitans sp.]|uniref:hypothetical protein n=1 Tax=Acerihabitans sp. TaxID=2811394 RepID=UPI002ED812DD